MFTESNILLSLSWGNMCYYWFLLDRYYSYYSKSDNKKKSSLYCWQKKKKKKGKINIALPEQLKTRYYLGCSADFLYDVAHIYSLNHVVIWSAVWASEFSFILPLTAPYVSELRLSGDLASEHAQSWPSHAQDEQFWGRVRTCKLPPHPTRLHSCSSVWAHSPA